MTVTLREFDDRDEQLIVAASVDPRIVELTTIPASCSAENARDYLDRQRALARGEAFAIDVDGVAVGQLIVWNEGKHRRTLSYWIAPANRGRGYATDAIVAAFDRAAVERVDLYVEPENEASWRAAATAGFVREGLLRAWQPFPDGSLRDAYVYARIRA